MTLKHLIAAAIIPFACNAFASGDAPHWEYEGKTGPKAWGDLDHGFAECKLGKEQSPIDIRSAKKAGLAPLSLTYKASGAEVVNNGHTIQVNLADAGDLTLDGSPYKLVQFHFHTPSEERIGGKAFPLVAHLVHKNAEGKLAVVGVMIKQGKANAALNGVFGHLPAHAGEKQALDAGFNVADMLPVDKGYYKYMGSLTTPPCSEGVRWQVLKTPIEASKAQIEAFQKLYKMNARPLQPLNGRALEQS
ncbi:carbonic anhydrase [Noviherbaspirillum galbum]|uniref:carbonic anhydrase n=1 Tax=Noviherbaspirillum galbum TaxID=2709383 RepID=A0A6B3SRF7_9BURK|nr:carbonic anhydrase family protein [Noviherbaspirillum galbum]NEX63231.1 carbonic anhydrase family protein [Noviherbaspirillum galbum]